MSLRRFIPDLLILFLLLALGSCTDDWLRSDYDTTVRWQGGYEGPLVYGSLGLKDLLEEYDTTGYVSEDSTGLLYAAYSKDTTLRAPDLIDIPDQDFLQVFFRVDSTIPGWYLDLLGDTIYFTQDKGSEFKRSGNERLDSVFVKAGDMEIYVRSSIRHEGILTISSEDVILDGENYEDVIMISDPSGNFEETFSIPMDGAVIKLDNSVPDSTSLYMNYVFALINSGNDINPSEEVEIVNSFKDLEFSAAYGTVGDWDSLLINQAELEFELLEGSFEGTIDLADAQLNIVTDNSMGVPFDIELLDLVAYFNDGSETDITIDTSANPIRVDAPDLSQVGQSVESTTRIDNTNSNINVATTSDISGFQYSVRAIANPEDPEQDNFILEESEMDIMLEGLIPLDLRIYDVVLADTFNFDIASDTNSELGPEDIISISIRMETDNSMPIDLGIQVYFIDTLQNWLRLDSLFGADREVFVSGLIDADGRVIQASNKVTTVEFTGTQIENILDANRLLMKAFVTTIDEGTRYVKFYSNYSLDFKLGTRIELDYTTEPDNN